MIQELDGSVKRNTNTENYVEKLLLEEDTVVLWAKDLDTARSDQAEEQFGRETILSNYKEEDKDFEIHVIKLEIYKRLLNIVWNVLYQFVAFLQLNHVFVL